MFRRITLSVAIASLAGCATQSEPVAVVAPPPVPVAVAPRMPAGASPNMVIPALLADGRYATPNRDLTPVATVWHLRVALNVAALACRDDPTLVSGYNALLTAQKGALARTEAAYAAQYRASGGVQWRDSYDDAMTRLYNFFSLSPARAGFCAAAARVTAESAGLTEAALPAFAAAKLPELEAPFTEFYRAYAAWQAGTPEVSRSVIAISATSAPGGMVAPAPPHLEVDPAIFTIE